MVYTHAHTKAACCSCFVRCHAHAHRNYFNVGAREWACCQFSKLAAPSAQRHHEERTEQESSTWKCTHRLSQGVIQILTHISKQIQSAIFIREDPPPPSPLPYTQKKEPAVHDKILFTTLYDSVNAKSNHHSTSKAPSLQRVYFYVLKRQNWGGDRIRKRYLSVGALVHRRTI